MSSVRIKSDLSVDFAFKKLEIEIRLRMECLSIYFQESRD